MAEIDLNQTFPSRPGVIPLGLYIHFPWCVKKCPYCDFNSHEISGQIPESAYVSQLIKDLRLEAKTETRTRLHSIFLGGGTPSLFSPRAIETLMAAISDLFDIENIEVTMEANPGTFDESHFEGYLKAGVNRLSLGAQSFDDENLQQLGRIHDSTNILDAFAGARKAGFANVNIDLMYGLPGQSVDGALADLSQAIALAPEHISWYQLTIEKNTYFYRYPPILPQHEQLFAIHDQGGQWLNSNSYDQYEISAHAFRDPGMNRSAHNVNYWQFGDYLGIGAGAHGKVTRENGIYRSTKTRIPKDYLADSKGQTTPVAESDVLLEFLMNALRLNEGFTTALFEQRTGLPTSSLDHFVAEGSSRNLILLSRDSNGDRILTTELGRRFLDDLLLLA